MNDPYRRVALILIICVFGSHAKTILCPFGFEFAEYKIGLGGLCYRLKGPEAFSDSFKNCSGNLYTIELYNKLNITWNGDYLWTQYKAVYPGGRFIDWSYTNTTGSVLKTTELPISTNEELCLVVDEENNYSAVSCERAYERYCFVYPYDNKKAFKIQSCAGFNNSHRFYSPLPTCLANVTAVGEAAVRATWKQGKEICEKHGGYLLNFGWIYANYRGFVRAAHPLGFAFNSELSELKLHVHNGTISLPRSEWRFKKLPRSNKTLLSALGKNMQWFSVDSSYVFYDVICEVSVPLKEVILNLTINLDNRLILNVSERVSSKYIICFTDSDKEYPTKVELDDEDNIYILEANRNGYYWCIHTDSKNYTISQSNKLLYVPKLDSLHRVYATKLRLDKPTKLSEFHKIKERLHEYIYLRNMFAKVYTAKIVSEETLKGFSFSISGYREKEVFSRVNIKKWFVNGTQLLIHFELDSDMSPVYPGTWRGIEVVSMKPVYYCTEDDVAKSERKHLGESITNAKCETKTCVGDYNEGVQWLITKKDDCEPKVTVTLSKALRIKEVTQMIPTVATLIPTTTMSTTDLESTTFTTDYSPVTETVVTQQYYSTTSPIQRDIRDSSEEATESTRRPTRPPPPDSVTTELISTVTNPTDVITVIPTLPPITPPRPPGDQLLQVMEDLESIINNDTLVGVSLDAISGSFDQVDGLLALDEDIDIPSELLHLLDNIGPRIDLEGTDMSAIRENIALVVAIADEANPMRGLRIATRDTDAFTDQAFEVIRDEINSTLLQTDTSDVVVKIPGSVSVSNQRVSFVVFRNDRAFRNPDSDHSVNSRVISIKVGNITQFENEEYIDIYLNPLVEAPGSNQQRACAYWEFGENGTGYWSQEGCTLIHSTEEGMLDYCRCTHLTHFAEILIPRTSFSDAHEKALEVISVIGCLISIIGLIMVGVTATLFRSWRRDFTNKIWLQLCLAIFITSICFLVIVFSKFHEYNIACMLIGVLLHYSVLASFCWMLVAAIISYRKLVIVFSRDASHKLLKACAFSWGAPCAIVGILLSVAPRSYEGQFDGEVQSGAFCYPSGLSMWLTVYAPIALMLLANWMLFILIVRSVFASRRIQRHGDSNEALRCASVSCLLVFLFGLPWVFGLFLGNIVTVYLFTLTATLQGFVLFLFFVPGNKKTRDLWLNKLKIKQTRKVPVTSSTYTNRSTGGNPASRGGNTSIVPSESKVTKPRSLSSSDDSRFS